MTTLSHRERVVKALSHEEPDRVPIDFGYIASSINTRAYANLVKHLGLKEELQRPELQDLTKSFTNLTPGPAIMERFEVDTRSLHVDPPKRVHEQLDETRYRDEWGVIRSRSEDDDPHIKKPRPFQGKDITLADLNRHPWPNHDTPGRFEGLRDRARKMHEETDYAIVVCVGSSPVALCQGLRGFTEWMEDLVLDPALAEGLLEHVTEGVVGSTRAILREVGDYVDVVWFAGDLGFQDRAYFRPEMFRRQVKPYLGRMVEAIKSDTKAKVAIHSDGSIYRLIPDLIDIGVDAINPVQVSTKNMDSRRLKAEFGHHLGFWGAIDTQRVLPFGTPEDVREEVKARIRDLAPGGGYVLTSCHNIQAEVTPENILALYESALEFGRYEQLAAV